MCPLCRQPGNSCRAAAPAVPAGDGIVRARCETKGRGGKSVPLVRGLPLAAVRCTQAHYQEAGDDLVEIASVDAAQRYLIVDRPLEVAPLPVAGDHGNSLAGHSYAHRLQHDSSKAVGCDRRHLAGTASTPRHPGVAVRNVASSGDCFRWTSAAPVDPEPTSAALNSPPRSGRSRKHRGPRRWPRSSGHTQVGGTQGD